MNTLAPTRRSVLAAAIVSLTALVAAATTEAASITWGAATNIAGDTDVSTNGTLLGAVNFSPGTSPLGSTTINGVTFIDVNPMAPSSYSMFSFTNSFQGSFANPAAGTFSTLSADYRRLLSGSMRTYTTHVGPQPFEVTISGLAAGERYEFQFWSNLSQFDSLVFQDSSITWAGNAGANWQSLTGNIVALDQNTTDAVGGLGQFAIGTFLADNATQEIRFTGGPGRVNGFQLRQVAVAPPVSGVPEPGSALVGMLTLGLCGARLGRRQRVSQ